MTLMAPVTPATPVSTEPSEAPATSPPALRVLRGSPSAEELAALAAVLAARAAASCDGPALDAAVSLWRDRTALVGAPLLAGPGAWRASGLPR